MGSKKQNIGFVRLKDSLLAANQSVTAV